MRKKKSIMLSLLFALLLTFMLGTTSLAATKSTTVATIGKKQYTTLAKAVSAVKKGQTITVVKNITTAQSLEIKKNGVTFTIDFGGHTYKCTHKSKYAIFISGGKVTIKNAKMSSRALFKITSKGKLTINGGTYKTQAPVSNSGDMTIQKGTFNRTSYSDNYSEGYSSLITNYGPTGKLTIKGGTFNANGRAAILNSGTLKISDGKFTAKEIASMQVLWESWGYVGLLRNYGDGNKGGTIEITGGTFNSPFTVIANVNGNVTIKGGTFTADQRALLHTIEGSVKISKGTFISLASSKYAMLYLWNGKTTITGGTFTGKKASFYYKDKAAVLKQSKATVKTKSKQLKTGYISE